MPRTALASLALLAACTGQEPFIFGGTPTELMFPFDGERSWTYRSTDPDVPYELYGELLQESEQVGDAKVYTINYFKDCFRDQGCVQDELAFALRMSNYSPDGVFINGFDPSPAVGDEQYLLDPPLKVANREALRDESVETTTAGLAFSSLYRGPTSCDDHIIINSQWECYIFEITADADLFPVTGTFYAVNGQGLAAMAFAGEAHEWQLLSAEAVDADGVW